MKTTRSSQLLSAVQQFAFLLTVLFSINNASAGEVIKQAQMSANAYQGKVIKFTGEITHESVEQFISENRNTDVQLLHLTSLGGRSTAKAARGRADANDIH